MNTPVNTDHQLALILERLDRERVNRGMKVSDLCRKAHITVYTYYHWLEGRTSPSVALLMIVLDKVGLRLEIVENNETGG